MKRLTSASAALVLSTITAPSLFADQIFQWSSSASGYTLSGNAAFSTQRDGSLFDLIIVVNNTSPVGPSVPSQILTGLYFDILGASQTSLAMISAVATDGFVETGNYIEAADATAGSNICAPGAGGSASTPACPATVAGGWESGYWPSGNNGYSYGIGTTGGAGAFNGNPGTGTGQLNYGILPLATSISPALVNPNTGVTNEFPYVNGTGTFVLAGLSSPDIVIAAAAGVYGTASDYVIPASQNQSSFQNLSTPEPSTAVEASAVSILFFAAVFRRIRKARGRRVHACRFPSV
jgi:hypothetical protein